MEKRAAFSRAWDFLNFKPAAKWLAVVAGIAGSIFYVAMLLVLGVFIHLLVYRGEMLEPGTSRIGRLLGWLAGWQSWLWPPADSPQVHLGQLLRLAVAALVLAAGWATLLFTRNYLAAVATTEAALRMRRAVYHHTFRLGALVFRAAGPGEAVGLFTRHIEAIRDALFAWLTSAVREPVQLALLLLLGFLIDFWLALVLLVAAGLAWLLAGQLAAVFQSSADRAGRQAASQLALLQESLLLIRLVKCCVMEIFSQGRVERQLAGYARAQLRGGVTEALRGAAVAFLSVMAGVACLFLVGLMVLQGKLSVAGAAVFAAALASYPGSVRRWREQRRLLEQGKESAVALFKFLDRPGDVSQVIGAEALPPVSRRIEFDNVGLREPGAARMLLQDVSLSIPGGQRVGLVGPDDRETHALVYLLLRLLDPTSGEIRVDEHNLRWVALDSLRKQIGVVLQNNLVFNDTVANNISGGDSGFKLPQVMEAAKLTHAHQFIHKLPKGYDTPIGDLGHSLNVGEQFRIALARAFLRNPTVMIIEEPAGSYLDEDTRDLLDDTYARVLPGRTAIFLPHREATTQSCARLFLLRQGRLEAQGEHLELMKQSALYRHLFYTEFNEFVRGP